MRNVKCENLFCFVDENCCKIIYFCANFTFEQSRGRCVGIVIQGEYQKYRNKQIFADPHIVFELLIILYLQNPFFTVLENMPKSTKTDKK